MRNSNFAAFIDVFTSNTYVMVIMSDSTIRMWPMGGGFACARVQLPLELRLPGFP